MKNIKGPKSALTDFIEENKITVKLKRGEAEESKEIREVSNKKKRQKRIQYQKPVEIVNYEELEMAKEDSEYEKILLDLNSHDLDDEKLKKLALYLSRRRKMSKFYFDFLAESCKHELYVYDCSPIKNYEYNFCKDLKIIELHQCGQLTDSVLNFLLSHSSNLETLKVTGGFMLENFEIPRSLKVLDISHCSRLSDSFIDQINEKFTFLEELRISYCYGLTKCSVLRTEVNRLFLCETKVSENFLSGLKQIEVLSIKSCPNINTLNPDLNLQYLDMDSVVTIKEIPPYLSLRYLNISECKLISSISFPLLEDLNVSNVDLNQDHIKQICQLKYLKTVNVSWNNIINDEILKNMAERLNIAKIYVFGCFSLSKESVKYAYEVKDRCIIIGNPSETSYLLND